MLYLIAFKNGIFLFSQIGVLDKVHHESSIQTIGIKTEIENP
jgi:hypothetical protein